MSKPEISYLPEMDIKPSAVDGLGTVTFTDGVNYDILANQKQCEAYGYTYDRATGTCRAFNNNPNLVNVFRNNTNKVSGQSNSTAAGTTNSYIIGSENVVNGDARNNIVVGNQNQITNGIDNTMVYGTLGESTANNSIVLGGNAYGDTLGERQSITVMFGRTSTTGSNIASYMNNTTDSYFAVPDNTAIYFHADVIAVRIGGTSGSGAVGDYASWVERGVIINKSGTATVSRERDAIKSSGTVTNWQPTGIIVSGTTNFTLRVRGEADTTIEWAATVQMTQMKTSVAL